MSLLELQKKSSVAKPMWASLISISCSSKAQMK